MWRCNKYRGDDWLKAAFYKHGDDFEGQLFSHLGGFFFKQQSLIAVRPHHVPCRITWWGGSPKIQTIIRVNIGIVAYRCTAEFFEWNSLGPWQISSPSRGFPPKVVRTSWPVVQVLLDGCLWLVRVPPKLPGRLIPVYPHIIYDLICVIVEGTFPFGHNKVAGPMSSINSINLSGHWESPEFRRFVANLQLFLAW